MPTGKRQHGFSYLFVLMLVGLVGLGLAAAGTLWSTEAQREREAELLFIGQQYHQAIKSYYELDPNQPRLPQSVDDLLEDPRRPEPVRHLRRAWNDPFGGRMQLILAVDGRGIVGVASTSARAPRKQHGFPANLEGFSQAETLADWKFVFVPPMPAPAQVNAVEARK